MNSVNLIGRLTRNPEIRYTSGNDPQAVARFSIAINRGRNSRGDDLGADFPSIVCFGRTAELVEKYVSKGQQLAVSGRVHTGSYEKDGKKYYTTEIVAERIEFLDRKSEGAGPRDCPEPETEVPEGFSMLDEDIPF